MTLTFHDRIKFFCVNAEFGSYTVIKGEVSDGPVLCGDGVGIVLLTCRAIFSVCPHDIKKVTALFNSKGVVTFIFLFSFLREFLSPPVAKSVEAV